MTSTLRHDLPRPIPARIARLPVERGYPVPYFVASVDGHYDFRVVDPLKMQRCVADHRCWICGDRLGRHLAFLIGPMCAINRISSEPPSHRECAEWAVRACPFLVQRQSCRRTTGLPQDISEPAGTMIERQPGVILLWVTDGYERVRTPSGTLFGLREPTGFAWYREGRPATRTEVIRSIDEGYPALHEMAVAEGPHAVDELERMKTVALRFVEAIAEEVA